MLRDILNRARWKDGGLEGLEIHVLHRGAPGDRRVVAGKRVLGIRPGGIEVAPEANEGIAFIPYHRFLGIYGMEIETGIQVVSGESPMLVIDGSAGEGGGQILRTSLALSLALGRPFAIEKIRANRKKPGLERQHLTCVHAAALVSGADVTGAELGSARLEFRPGAIRSIDTELDIGSAGSTSLVIQTIAHALARAPGRSRLVAKGGTHALWAPPYPFLAGAWLPLVERAGLAASLRMHAPGFYPAGGGEVELTVAPSDFVPLHLDAPTEPTLDVHAIVANLPEEIAHREITAVTEALGEWRVHPTVESVRGAGHGNAMWLIAREGSGVANVFSGIGAVGVRAEDLGRAVARAFFEWRDSGAAVEEHLADQLMLPIALGGAGSYTTRTLSLHARTNMEVIRAFTGLRLRAFEESEHRVRIALA